MKKTQSSAQAAGSGSSLRVRHSATASATAAAITAAAEIAFALPTNARGWAPKRRYSEGSISRVELYSKNQVHRDHPASANGRFTASVTAAKIAASSSVRRRG